MTLASVAASTTTSAQLFPRIFAGDTNWQPDGLSFLGRIGLLTPDFDPVPESELQAMAPRGVSIHSSRVKYIHEKPGSFSEPPNIDNATELLIGLNPSVIVSAFTSSSYEHGVEGDELLRVRLEKQTNGIPFITTSKAALKAFRFFNASKIALIHPPWFSDKVNLMGKTYFESQGFNIVSCNQITPSRKFSEVAPEELYQWVKKNTSRQADIIFIGGNGMRTAGAISRLELTLDKPILTANQVLLWAALRLIGINSKVNNYGKIFKKS